MQTSETLVEQCPKCGPVDPTFRWQNFKNSSKHLRADCSKCKRFIRYVEQTSERLVVAESPKQATLTCRSCGIGREPGVLLCPVCNDSFVRRIA